MKPTLQGVPMMEVIAAENTELCTECICQEGGEPAIDLSCKLLVILKPHFLERNIKEFLKANPFL